MSTTLRATTAALALSVVVLINGPPAAADFNVDPYYNISCKPGRATMWIDLSKKTGVYFICEESAISRSFALNGLSEAAVVDEFARSTGTAGAGLMSYVLTKLAVFFDVVLRADRYVNKIQGYERKAQQKREEAKRYTGSKRRKLLDKAADYEDDADEYRGKLKRLCKTASESLPQTCSIRLRGNGS